MSDASLMEWVLDRRQVESPPALAKTNLDGGWGRADAVQVRLR